MNAPDVLPRGTVLGGRYVVGERLGQGGWGAVYDGLQRDLDRRVAIKVLRSERVFDHDGLARFHREARAAAALGHPNIVQVTDFQMNAGEPPFMVMEHLPGKTLGDLLRATPRLPRARVLAIAHQVLSALEAAHRAGIVHRDVKPDNVFLVSTSGHEDFVKLLDFGIAKIASDGAAWATGANTLLGTPAFMAPEQVAATGDIDARVDLYAVGALMYLALVGRPPIEAPSLASLLHAIVYEKPVPLRAVDASIDAAIAAVVERALHKDRDGRFATAPEMRAAVAACAAGSSASVVPGGGTVSRAGDVADTLLLAPPRRRTGALVAIVAAVVVMIGGAAVGLFVWSSRASSALPGAAPPASVAPSSVVVASATPPPPTAAPTASEASSARAPAPSAPKPPLPAARMTGRTPRLTMGGYSPYGIATGKPIVLAAMPAITACHVKTELEPPNHESTDYALTIDPGGTVTDVRRIFARTNELHPTFDACMKGVLKKTVWPATPKGGAVKVGFTANR